jgi:putative transposase
VKKSDGYYLKVTCYIGKNKMPKTKTNGKEIGLDFGIKTNITTSEGEKLDVSVEESERLKRLQKKMSRQTKGSNNRYKTIKKIKREYLNLSNKKKDKANKIVHMLKQYNTIVIQDEQLSEWHKQKGMSKVVQHSCMGMIKSKLMKLDNVIVLDKFIPTTKWWPNCHKLNELSLNDRTYKCECGYSQDRDIHAAQNMLNIKNLVMDNLTVPTERRGDSPRRIQRGMFCFAEQP